MLREEVLIVARFTAVSLALGVVGCSSVPDVVFSSEDASVPDEGGGSDAGADSATNGGTEVSCPDRPPRPGEGVCCDKRLCIGCNENQCWRCERADCEDGTECCARGNHFVDCRSRTSCR
jgi:hypothetical protein